jgi:hypothetical protein
VALDKKFDNDIVRLARTHFAAGDVADGGMDVESSAVDAWGGGWQGCITPACPPNQRSREYRERLVESPGAHNIEISKHVEAEPRQHSTVEVVALAHLISAHNCMRKRGAQPVYGSNTWP